MSIDNILKFRLRRQTLLLFFFFSGIILTLISKITGLTSAYVILPLIYCVLIFFRFNDVGISRFKGVPLLIITVLLPMIYYLTVDFWGKDGLGLDMLWLASIALFALTTLVICFLPADSMRPKI